MRKILFFIAALVATQANALNLSGVKITSLNMATPLGDILFISTSGPNNAHGCHFDHNFNYVLPLDSPLSKNIYAALLVAMNSGKYVDISGSESCDVYGGIETLTSVRVWTNQ